MRVIHLQGETLMTDPVKIIRRETLRLKAAAAPVWELRETCKTSGGRLTDAGRDFIRWAKKTKVVSQATVARVLDVTPAAVSRHWNN
jgi:hypothetical protein